MGYFIKDENNKTFYIDNKSIKRKISNTPVKKESQIYKKEKESKNCSDDFLINGLTNLIFAPFEFLLFIFGPILILLYCIFGDTTPDYTCNGCGYCKKINNEFGICQRYPNEIKVNLKHECGEHSALNRD